MPFTRQSSYTQISFKLIPSTVIKYANVISSPLAKSLQEPVKLLPQDNTQKYNLGSHYDSDTSCIHHSIFYRPHILSLHKKNSHRIKFRNKSKSDLENEEAEDALTKYVRLRLGDLVIWWYIHTFSKSNGADYGKHEKKDEEFRRHVPCL